jgi:hypothetical protein
MKRISTCKLEFGKLLCPISSLKKFLSTTSKVRLDVYINNIKAISLFPYFTFYNDFEFKSIHPSSFIQIGKSGFIYLNSSLPLDYLGNNYRIQYFNNVTKFYETCSFIQSKDLKCPFPSFNETGKISIGITQSDVFEILETPLTVYDSQWISIDSLSSKGLSFTHETILYIIGSKFIDTTSIMVKCSDSFIETHSIAKYINETHLQTTVQPFYKLNIVFPRVLKVSVSFDGGLSFMINNTNVYIDNLKNIELFPSYLFKGDLTKGIQIKNYPEEGLHYNTSKYTVDYFLNYNQSISLKLNCSKPQKSGLICDLMTPPLIVGNYRLKLLLVNLENGQREEIQITSMNWIYIYGKKNNLIKEISIQSIEPKIYVLNSNNLINITANWNVNLLKNVKFRFKYSTNALFVDALDSDVIVGKITDNQITVTPLVKKGTLSSILVEFTFNDLNYHSLAFTQRSSSLFF